MFTTTASRKVLVPLATLLAAGAVAIGSGATWTSTTDTTLSVTAGNILHANDHGSATVNITKLTPGDTVTGTLIIENRGDVPVDLAVSEATNPAPTNAFADVPVLDALGLPVVVDGVTLLQSSLQLEILVGTTSVWTGDFDAVPANLQLKDELPAATPNDTLDQVAVTFKVTLVDGSPNIDQGKTAGAKFLFVTTEDGNNGVSNWTDFSSFIPGV